MDSEPALVAGIILSDHVVREQVTNKATCVGIFHMYNLPHFPCGVPRFFATVGITNLQADVRELDATCRLEVAGSAHVLMSASAHLKLNPESPPLTKNVVLDLTFPFAGVTFPAAGTYKVVVLVNTEPIGHRLIEVVATTIIGTGEQKELKQ